MASSNPTALRSAMFPLTRMSHCGALTHVDSAVRGTGGVGVADHAMAGVERVDPVQAVVVGGDVVDPETLQRWKLSWVPGLVISRRLRRRAVRVVQAGEQHAVERGAGDRQVLHPHPVGDHDHGVGSDSSAVDDGSIAIFAADRHVGSVDLQLFGVVPGCEEDRATLGNLGSGLLKGLSVLGNPDQHGTRGARPLRRATSRSQQADGTERAEDRHDEERGAGRHLVKHRAEKTANGSLPRGVSSHADHRSSNLIASRSNICVLLTAG